MTRFCGSLGLIYRGGRGCHQVFSGLHTTTRQSLPANCVWCGPVRLRKALDMTSPLTRPTTDVPLEKDAQTEPSSFCFRICYADTLSPFGCEGTLPLLVVLVCYFLSRGLKQIDD